MTNPDPDARLLLRRYAKHLELSPPQREALWNRLQASTTPRAVVPSGRWTWAAAMIVLAAGLGTALGWSRARVGPTAVSPASHQASYDHVTMEHSGVTRSASNVPATQEPPAPSASVPIVPASSSPSPSSSVHGTSSGGSLSRTSPRLADEIRMLDHARQSLREHAPQRALRFLHEHNAAFPRGQLREDAWALEIQTLCQLDRPSEATNRARLFLQRYPHSPHPVSGDDPCLRSPSRTRQ